MKYVLEMKAEERQKADAVDFFLAGIAVTLKSFSTYYQNTAKQKIFSIVA
jgi:hypothetical protein